MEKKIETTVIAPSTQLFVGRSLLTDERLRPFCAALRTVVIADAALEQLYAAALSKQLQADLITIPSGETSKTPQTAALLLEKLFQLECGRDTLLIALGGGVTTDLVGFVASLYMRGVPLLLIPTTLLAMVDAAIGGKTGVDTPYGKNLIGTLYYPKAIFADLDLLNSLSERERLNGLAEIIKLGLVYDAALCNAAHQSPVSDVLILQAIQGKASIVERDPKEHSLRRILNFGHTIGHALEAVAHYTIAHGEAVALGCLAESYLSHHLGYLSSADFAQITELFRLFPLKLPKGYSRKGCLQAMTLDKKRAAGEIRFVLIDKVGHALPFDHNYCTVVPLSAVETTFDWMESRFL